MAINAFGQSTATYGQQVTSTVDSSALVTRIQQTAIDDYFDTTSKLSRVRVEYTHQADRQKKTLLHLSPGFTSETSWSSFSLDGTWEKTKITSHGHEGAKSTLLRADIGTNEDIVMTDGTMALNT